jgi:hypothetical protein
MIQCGQGSLWLILDRPSPLWCYHWPKIWQIPDRSKPKPSLFAAETPNTALLLNRFISSICDMCPMSDDTILGWLCVVDFGQAISSLVLSLQENIDTDYSETKAQTKRVCS